MDDLDFDTPAMATTSQTSEATNDEPSTKKVSKKGRMTLEEERALIRSAQAGNERAMNELVKSHIGLVHSELRRHLWTGIAADDLLGEGVLGLLESIRRFDLNRHTRLSTYAVWWIRASVWDFVWKNRRIVPIPSTRRARKLRVSIWRVERSLRQKYGRPASVEELADALEVDPEDIHDIRAALGGRDVGINVDDEGPEIPDDAKSPEQIVEAQDTREHLSATLQNALAQLPVRERTIVERRLLSEDRPTLTALGDELGVSRERVRQLQKRAERQLREYLADVA